MDANGPIILLAGATGALGRRIANELAWRGAHVRALVRYGSDAAAQASLTHAGAELVPVDYRNRDALADACRGAQCVVSALSGLRETIVDAQTTLLEAALRAGVRRFIPSDYCIDYTGLPAGNNRNLDLRREFANRIEATSIRPTGILNGMFTDLLQGQAPVVLFKFQRVLYWGNANQALDFTTMDNTAAFTALAALDNDTPRYLRIAGDVQDAAGICMAAGDATGVPFRLFRAGSLGALRTMIRITKTVAPQKSQVFPPWQGMQYLHDMFEGRVKLATLDNARYPEIAWTRVTEVLRNRVAT